MRCSGRGGGGRGPDEPNHGPAEPSPRGPSPENEAELTDRVVRFTPPPIRTLLVSFRAADGGGVDVEPPGTFATTMVLCWFSVQTVSCPFPTGEAAANTESGGSVLLFFLLLSSSSFSLSAGSFCSEW